MAETNKNQQKAIEFMKENGIQYNDAVLEEFDKITGHLNPGIVTIHLDKYVNRAIEEAAKIDPLSSQTQKDEPKAANKSVFEQQPDKWDNLKKQIDETFKNDKPPAKNEARDKIYNILGSWGVYYSPLFESLGDNLWNVYLKRKSDGHIMSLNLQVTFTGSITDKELKQ